VSGKRVLGEIARIIAKLRQSYANASIAKPIERRRRLRVRRRATTWPIMTKREQWRRFLDNPIVEWSLFGLGVILLILSPVVGVIPGPGGIVVAGIGLALILKTSMWAKRHYVRVKRWQPKAGRWMDWALRRQSAKRREQLAKAEESSTGN
jgi:hypothetical protein